MTVPPSTSASSMNLEQLEARLSRRPHSPLFAHLADMYLSAGRSDDARNLCASGIQHYPHYLTAHLILARTFAYDGNFPEAIASLEQIPFHDSATRVVNELLKEWKEHSEQPTSVSSVYEKELEEPPPQTEIVIQDDTPEEISHEEFDDEEVSEPEANQVSELDVNEASETETQIIDITPTPDVSTPHVEPEDIPTSSLSTDDAPPAAAEVPLSPQQEDVTFFEFSDEGRIVSRTLAEIYAMQGEFAEAIITYQLLKQRQPERSEEFDQRIKELEVKIHEKLGEH